MIVSVGPQFGVLDREIRSKVTVSIEKGRPKMITNFRRLSEALDKAAPTAGAVLVAAIRADKERICNDIAQKGAAYVEVNGQTFKVSSANEKGAYRK